jgi:hypothetical protein
MLKFGSADPTKLTKNTLESVAVDTFIKYLHQLMRADAFDDSVIINLIDSETINLLTYYFNPTEAAREHPITHTIGMQIQSFRRIDLAIVVPDGTSEDSSG